MRVAICSYQRSQVVQAKTLAMLQRHHVDPALVTIFVANADEHRTYARALGETWPGQLVVAERGMREVRNFEHSYFEPGQHVVSLDDDVTETLVRIDDKHLVAIDNLRGFWQQAFATCERVGARLWGVYPVHNAFYMKDTVTTDLRLCVGTCYGFIAQDEPPTIELPCKTDYEWTLRNWQRDGAVVRFNGVTVKSPVYGSDSGGFVDRDTAMSRLSAFRLRNMFPGLVASGRTRQTNGMTEVRLVSPRSGSAQHHQG
jgi:hypothetical protein